MKPKRPLGRTVEFIGDFQLRLEVNLNLDLKDALMGTIDWKDDFDRRHPLAWATTRLAEAVGGED